MRLSFVRDFSSSPLLFLSSQSSQIWCTYIPIHTPPPSFTTPDSVGEKRNKFREMSHENEAWRGKKKGDDEKKGERREDRQMVFPSSPVLREEDHLDYSPSEDYIRR